MEVDYLPVAVSGGANVDTQANFAGSAYQSNGFVNGIAQPAQANKIWRQTSMMASALANWISNQLATNVIDDGNLASLIGLLTAALQVGVTQVAGDNSTKLATTAFVQAALAAAVAALTNSLTKAQHDVTGVRVPGVQYPNDTGREMILTGYMTAGGGAGDCQISVTVNGIVAFSDTLTGTVGGEPCGFFAFVPIGGTYTIAGTNRLNAFGKVIENY